MKFIPTERDDNKKQKNDTRTTKLNSVFSVIQLL